MVAFERSHSGPRVINAAIEREILPQRSSDDIKGERSLDYRALLNAGAISEDPSPDSVPTGEEFPGATPRPLPPSSSPAFDTETQGGEDPPVQVESPLQETLQNTLEDLGTTLNVAVPLTTEDIQCKLDEWSPPLLVAYSRPRRSKHVHLPKTAKGRRRYQYARFQQA